jgi:hypothetical protein
MQPGSYRMLLLRQPLRCSEFGGLLIGRRMTRKCGHNACMNGVQTAPAAVNKLLTMG